MRPKDWRNWKTSEGLDRKQHCWSCFSVKYAASPETDLLFLFLDTMLDFHTILFPKNSRTSKISRRKKKVLNIRLHEKEESNTFFKLGTLLSGCASSERRKLHLSAPSLQYHWGFIAEHPKGVPSLYNHPPSPIVHREPTGVVQHCPSKEGEKGERGSDKKVKVTASLAFSQNSCPRVELEVSWCMVVSGSMQYCWSHDGGSPAMSVFGRGLPAFS